MLLAIDIGNTNLVVGVFDKNRLRCSWRITSQKDRTAEEYTVVFHNLFELAGLSSSQVKATVVCSVVAPLNEAIDRVCRHHFGVSPLFIEPTAQDLIPIHYHPPSDVGADRIVNALAAFKLVGGPTVVVDFGTATTFDVVSARGEYVGGIIAPGITISVEALFARTARLPRVEVKKPPSTIGDSTVASMQSGIYYGYVGLVEGILARMSRELGELHVIATGGLAELIGHEAEGIDRVEKDLTLYGLQLFYQHLRRG